MSKDWETNLNTYLNSGIFKKKFVNYIHDLGFNAVFIDTDHTEMEGHNITLGAMLVRTYTTEQLEQFTQSYDIIGRDVASQTVKTAEHYIKLKVYHLHQHIKNDTQPKRLTLFIKSFISSMRRDNNKILEIVVEMAAYHPIYGKVYHNN